MSFNFILYTLYFLSTICVLRVRLRLRCVRQSYLRCVRQRSHRHDCCLRMSLHCYGRRSRCGHRNRCCVMNYCIHLLSQSGSIPCWHCVRSRHHGVLSLLVCLGLCRLHDVLQAHIHYDDSVDHRTKGRTMGHTKGSATPSQHTIVNRTIPIDTHC